MYGALSIIIGSCVLSTALIKRLKLQTTALESWLLIYLVGTLLGTWISFGIAATIGYGWIVPIFTALCLLVFRDRQWIYTHLITSIPTAFRKQHVGLFIFFVLQLIIFAPLFVSHMLHQHNGGQWSGGSTWGDLALHVTFIRQFARQEVFDLTSPIYSQVQSNYPFLLNFFTGMLFRNGFSLQLSLWTTGLTIFIATNLLWYTAMQRIVGKVRAIWVSSCIFFANGGLGFLLAYQEYKQSHQSVITFLVNQTKNYTHSEEHGLFWSNVMGDLVLPQRTLILGFALFVVFFWLISYLLHHPKKTPLIWTLMLALTAFTPLVHTHTFLTLVGVLVCITAYLLYKKQLQLRFVIIKVAYFLIFTIPQIAWQTLNTAATHSFVSVQPGWYKENGQSLVAFWVENMGVGVLFFVDALIWLSVTFRKKTVLKIYLLSLLALFGVTNVIQFQPYLFDNTKFMIFSYFAVAVTTGLIISELSFRKVWIIWLLIPISMLSGILAIIREGNMHWEMASQDMIAQSEQVRKLLPPMAIVLTGDTHTHPIPFLVGNPVVMGYRGWLWSHGFDYVETENDVKKMFAGAPEAQELLAKYDVSFVYISELERDRYHVNDVYFTQFPVVYERGDTRIYAVAPNAH
ncbi:hypothetical protein KA078_01945 [Candidatus Woesebacteria bacterium]|nr:hypothetical protein [Candidatus Woesebacteria bacterium]